MRLPMKELYLLSMVVSLSIVGCSGHTENAFASQLSQWFGALAGNVDPTR